MSDGRLESRRQLVHAAMTLFALLLRWLTWPQAAACAAAAVVLNWSVLPRLRADLRRPGGPFVDGVKTYPVAVLLLVLAAGAGLLDLPRAAAAWAVLGVGDAAANVAGRRFGGPRLLGRPDRSLGGSTAFVLLGGAAATAVWCFTGREPPTTPVVLGAYAAAAAAAFAELLWRARRLDDNLPIAIAAGTVLALLP